MNWWTFENLQRKCVGSKKKVKYLRLPKQKTSGNRDVAQLVEYASGGRVVAGSSPVIPTNESRSESSGIFITFGINHGLRIRKPVGPT